IGGGANSPVWRQMVADITGTEVRCPEITDAAALGAAIQAAWCDQRAQGVTLEALCNRLVHLDAQSLAEPNLARVEAYQEVYARYTQALKQRHQNV
ncbi:FGGY-family carbohydrate kinase, partial [Halomonas sp.]|uniref:FGGY-family carbohydrate kinase n=1 Tax=Halomonas sp. TaxID=1486246 RepID=UPI003F9DE2E6